MLRDYTATPQSRLRQLPKSLILRGRVFSRIDLKKIRSICRCYATNGRTRISEEICKTLNWRQANGWLKDRACRDVLRRLHSDLLVRLPNPKRPTRTRPYTKWTPPVPIPEKPRKQIIEISEPIHFRIAKGNSDESKWNELVQRYHYLSHKVSVGRCLKFLVFSGNEIVAAISLAESAWNVESRDKAIRYLGYTRSEVANNGRFLILPNVKIKNLASRILAMLAKEGVEAWKKYYATELKCLETFVDTLRFKGTSYKAANWTQIGVTKGFRKCGSAFLNSQSPKFVYLYPISHGCRQKLRHFCNDRHARLEKLP